MIALSWPWAYILLIPIIAIETWATRRYGIPLVIRLRSVSIANIVSTIIGWPIAWWIMVSFQMYVLPGGGGAYGLSTPFGVIASVTLQAAWLIPYEEDLYWMVPAAATFLMIPFFFISVLIEDQVHRFGAPDLYSPQRRKLTWTANLWSYGFLVSLFLIWLAGSFLTHQPKN